jgi:thiosulfate dehydrogenase [quinone] large subunit
MSDSSCSSSCRWDLAFANLLLRLWIGLRLIFAGLDKFRAGSGEDATFSVENYEKKMQAIANLTYQNGFLPENLCNLYAKPLGYLLLIGGIWAVIGLFSRLGLLFCGFVFLSLGVGLATLPDDAEVVYIGVHILVVAGALATNQHNKLSLDGLFCGKKKTLPEA